MESQEVQSTNQKDLSKQISDWKFRKQVLNFQIDQRLLLISKNISSRAFQFYRYFRSCLCLTRGDKFKQFSIEDQYLKVIGIMIENFKYDFSEKSNCCEIFSEQNHYYTCFDCRKLQSACLCYNCFLHSDHINHRFFKYQFSKNNIISCKCGIDIYWHQKAQKKTFCYEKHTKSFNQSQMQDHKFIQQYQFLFYMFFWVSQDQNQYFKKLKQENFLNQILKTFQYQSCQNNYSKNLSSKVLSQQIPKNFRFSSNKPILTLLFESALDGNRSVWTEVIPIVQQLYEIESFHFQILESYLSIQNYTFPLSNNNKLKQIQFHRCFLNKKLVKHIIETKSIDPLTFKPELFDAQQLELMHNAFSSYCQDLANICKFKSLNFKNIQEYLIYHFENQNISHIAFYRQLNFPITSQNLIIQFQEQYFQLIPLIINILQDQKWLLTKFLKQLYNYINLNIDQTQSILFTQERTFALVLFVYMQGDLQLLQTKSFIQTLILKLQVSKDDFSKNLIKMFEKMVKHIYNYNLICENQASKSNYIDYFIESLDSIYRKILTYLITQEKDFKIYQSINQISNQNLQQYILTFLSLKTIKIDELIVSACFKINKEKIYNYYEKFLLLFKKIDAKTFKNVVETLVSVGSVFNSFFQQSVIFQKDCIKLKKEPKNYPSFQFLTKKIQQFRKTLLRDFQNIDQRLFEMKIDKNELNCFDITNIIPHEIIQRYLDYKIANLNQIILEQNWKEQNEQNLYFLQVLDSVYPVQFQKIRQYFEMIYNSFSHLLNPKVKQKIMRKYHFKSDLTQKIQNQQNIDQLSFINSQKRQERQKIQERQERLKKINKMKQQKKKNMIKNQNFAVQIYGSILRTHSEDMHAKFQPCIICKQSNNDPSLIMSHISHTNYLGLTFFKLKISNLVIESCNHRVHYFCQMDIKDKKCFLCRAPYNILIPPFQQRSELKQLVINTFINDLTKFMKKQQILNSIFQSLILNIVLFGLTDVQKYYRSMLCIYNEMIKLLRILLKYDKSKIDQFYQNNFLTQIKGSLSVPYSQNQDIILQLIQNCSKYVIDLHFLEINPQQSTTLEDDKYSLAIKQLANALNKNKEQIHLNQIKCDELIKKIKLIDFPTKLQDLHKYMGYCPKCLIPNNLICICICCGWKVCFKCLEELSSHSQINHDWQNAYLMADDGCLKILNKNNKKTNLRYVTNLYKNYLNDIYDEKVFANQQSLEKQYTLQVQKIQQIEKSYSENKLRQFLNSKEW